jgi:phosphoenolpyruvate-protein kinase (PTS system EI component)
MTPAAIPQARRILRDFRSEDLRALARRVARLPTAQEVGRELEMLIASTRPA